MNFYTLGEIYFVTITALAFAMSVAITVVTVVAHRRARRQAEREARRPVLTTRLFNPHTWN
jgi:hypothetical protein